MSKPSVAVFGLNGALGESTLAAFSSSTFSGQFQLPVLAVTRDASTKTSTEFVKYVQGDLENDQQALVGALAHVDVVISLLAASPAVLASTEAILASVRPQIYVPSQFGADIAAANRIFPGLLAFKNEHSARVRASGVKVVDIYTSAFVGGVWLREVIGHVGADTASRTVTYLGSPDVKFSYSTLEDIGRVVASAAAKAFAAPLDFPDTLRVSSGLVSPAEVVDAYERAHGVKFKVEKVVPQAEVVEQAKAVWAKGFDYSRFFYYLNVLISQGPGGGVTFAETDDELVNPGESLWKWGKF